MARPERELESWFADLVLKPRTPVGNPTENKPSQDPGVRSCEPYRLRRSTLVALGNFARTTLLIETSLSGLSIRTRGTNRQQ